MRPHLFGKLLLCVCSLALLAAPFQEARAADAAVDLTDRCTVSVPVAFNRKSAERLTDGARETHATILGWTGLTVELPEGESAQCLYVEWMEAPERVSILEYDASGRLLGKRTFTDSTLESQYFLLAETARVKITGGLLLKVANVALPGPGELPESIRLWEPAATACDLLVVSAHCDDELLFFGGVIPYYAGERGYRVQLAYMAHGERMRQGEAMDGLWFCGVRNDPIFLGFPDIFFNSLQEAEKAWGREKTLEALVSLLRRTKPQVVLTHGTEGEYGHGAHRITASCMLEAVKLSADPAAYPESAKAYGTWQPKKLYLHIGEGDNRLMMDWETPLSAFQGMTAIQAADEAYHKHLSQLYLYSDVYNPGLNNSDFGLYFTTVGPDGEKNDFFEHIPIEELTVANGADAHGAK